MSGDGRAKEDEGDEGKLLFYIFLTIFYLSPSVEC